MKDWLLLILSALVLSLVGGLLASREMWGYALHRPDFFSDVSQAAEVLLVYEFDDTPKLNSRRITNDSVPWCTLEECKSLSDVLTFSWSDEHSPCTGKCIIAAASIPRRTDVVPAAFLRAVAAAMSKSSLPRLCERYFERSECALGGAFAVFRQADTGNTFIRVGVDTEGLPNDNDRHLFLSSLFKVPQWPYESGDLELVSEVSFFYEVAGLEGLQWPHLAMACLVVVIGCVTVVVLLGKFRTFVHIRR